MMSPKIRHFLTSSVWLLIPAAVANAATIAFDPFDSAGASGADPTNGIYRANVDTADGALGSDLNKDTKGGGIIGFGMYPWEQNSTTARSQNSGLETINRSPSNGGVRVLNFKGTGPSATHRAVSRQLDPYTPSDTYYMSAVFQLNTAASGHLPGAYLLAGFGDEAVATEEAMGTAAPVPFQGLLSGFRANETGDRIDLVVRATTDADAGTVEDFILVQNVQQLHNYFVALKVEINESGADTITAWVNPPPSMAGEEPSGGITFSAEAFSSTAAITHFGLAQQGLLHTAGNNSINRVGYFDSPTLGTTYASIVDSTEFFYQAFGSGNGRSDGSLFTLDNPSEWSLEPAALRLAAAGSDYVMSRATATIEQYSAGSDFGVRSLVTLTSLSGSPSESAIGHVLLGNAGATEYYFAQWIPNGPSGSVLRITEGASGTVLAEASWTGANAPGATYTLTSLGRHDLGGSLDLTFRLADETGHAVSVSALIHAPLSGTVFGFGARHRAADSAVWDIHDFGLTAPGLVDYTPQNAPFAYEFGMGAGQDGFDDLLPLHPRPDAWSLASDGLLFARDGGGWESSVSAISVQNYHAKQDFSLKTEMTLTRLDNLGLNRFGLTVLGETHDPFAAPFNPALDATYYSLIWFPATDDDTSEIRIRQGLNGANLASETWTGMHPRIANPFDGIGSVFTFEASGTFDASGALTLSFTLTDANGHSQTIVANIADPSHGTTFGFGGRTHGDQVPTSVFHTFSMEVGEPPATGTGYANWAAEYFTGTELEDPAVGGPDAAPAGDGVPNLVKYVLNQSPWTPLTAGDYALPSIIDGTAAITYFERPDAEDISYSVEVSSDLVNWIASPTAVEEVSRVDAGELQMVTVRALPGDTNNRGFIRIRVQL